MDLGLGVADAEVGQCGGTLGIMYSPVPMGCEDCVVFFNEFYSPRMSACVNVFLLLHSNLPTSLSDIVPCIDLES